MSKEIIAISGAGFALSIHPEAEAEKQKAIQLSKTVIAVEDEDQKERAVAIVGSIKALTKLCEKSRKEAKEPTIKLGREIDDLAKRYAGELDAEASRIESAIGDYLAVQRRKFEEEQRKLREEQAKLERAKQEQERAAREAEEARQRAADAERRAAEAKTKAERDKALAEQRRAEDEQRRADKESAEQARNAQAAEIGVAEAEDDVSQQATGKAEGASVKPEYEIEITDIHALYKAHPNAVKLEPRLLEIKFLIAQGKLDIPGVKLKEVTKVAVRAGISSLQLK